MTYLPDQDFLIQVALGLVPGFSLVHKSGRNIDVGQFDFELIATGGGSIVFLTTPSFVRVKAGDAADDILGNGARTIKITGVSAGLEEVSEVLDTAGTSPSASSTNQFFRIYSINAETVGIYGGTNVGEVVVEIASGLQDLIKIAAGDSQAAYGCYTIPVGKTGFLLSVGFAVDASKSAVVRALSRRDFTTTSGTQMRASNVAIVWAGLTGDVTFEPQSSVELPALTDLWFEARATGNNTAASVRFEILLVDDK